MQTATEPATVDKPLSKFGKAEEAKFSEIKELGWSVDGEPKSWFAHEKAGDLRSIGPATSISALHTQVKIATGTLDKGTGGGTANKPEATGNGKTVKIGSSTLEGGEFKDAAADSQPILTGTEDAVLEDLHTAGRDYRLTTMEILRLQKLQKTQRESCEKLMHKFADELSIGDDDEKFFTVDVDGESVDIVLETEEKEVLKTRKSAA